MDFQDVLKRLLNRETLSREEARSLMDEVMSGRAKPNQISSLLSILRFRGETVAELTGFAESLRAHMDGFDGGDVLDTCGTGGDGVSTFNISTAVAILISGMGVKVAKHGNRAVSSKSGSMDVIEQLGLEMAESKETAISDLKEVGICFLYAPLYHASMKHASGPRKDLGFRTVFNLLGPLANPARAKRQLLGVYEEASARKVAETLRNLGTERSLVVTGSGGLDELSITGPSRAFLVEHGDITTFDVEPEAVGLNRGALSDLQVEKAGESAQVIEAVLANQANPAARDIVLLNAGAALFVAGRAATIADGVHLARAALSSGVGRRQLQRLRSKRRAVRHA